MNPDLNPNSNQTQNPNLNSNKNSKTLAKLRGHHLICLQFYKGEGYDESFVKNLNKVMEKTKNGVVVVSGADEVCSACPYLKNGKCHYYEGAEEEIRYLDSLALKLLSLSEGDTVSWDEISRKIPEILKEWYKKACVNCDWREVCHVDVQLS